MNKKSQQTHTCQVCHQDKPNNKLLPSSMVSSGILKIIEHEHPEWDSNGYICFKCLNQYRFKYMQNLMEDDLGELDSIEQEVIESLQDNSLLSENLNEEYEKSLTFGTRLADKVAAFGGSWRFVIWAIAVLALWVLGNSLVLLWKPFDPYPFILLNLFLSMLAALQAPIIMMSQNRQETRDRMRAENDYQINLKAEMEIRVLNEKMDQLRHNEMRRFMEIQQMQMEMLNELNDKAG